jgi:hypothetical protein
MHMHVNLSVCQSQEMTGTSDPTLFNEKFEAKKALQNDVARVASSSSVPPQAAKPAAGILIPVHFHVLRSGPTPAQGDVPDAVIAAQIKVKFW